eukprot:TRINITY_DN24634_c0_g1_i2.p1 TRINITY_DN24634_c0_g1~~TRINITY_DN24634_c0_g1_i2.p1  ORF type:complete len:135 (-),score=0.57 TRINITY_DN24634_c0_g1_i2:92-496(-)
MCVCACVCACVCVFVCVCVCVCVCVRACLRFLSISSKPTFHVDVAIVFARLTWSTVFKSVRWRELSHVNSTKHNIQVLVRVLVVHVAQGGRWKSHDLLCVKRIIIRARGRRLGTLLHECSACSFWRRPSEAVRC